MFPENTFLHSRAPVPRATTERSRWHLLRSETEGANSCWVEHGPKERPRTVALTEIETMGPNHPPLKGFLSSHIPDGHWKAWVERQVFSGPNTSCWSYRDLTDRHFHKQEPNTSQNKEERARASLWSFLSLTCKNVIVLQREKKFFPYITLIFYATQNRRKGTLRLTYTGVWLQGKGPGFLPSHPAQLQYQPVLWPWAKPFIVCTRSARC